MRWRDLAVCVGFSFTVLLGLAGREGLAAATPGFTLQATNVTVSGMGSGTSNVTLTSVGGFSGQVGVSCFGPDTNLNPVLIPNCTQPVEYFALTANAPVSFTLPFTPPASVSGTAGTRPVQPTPGSSPGRARSVAGILSGLGLAAIRFRKKLKSNVSSAIVAVLGLAALAGMTGCIARGGLVMTPGKYSYQIQASPKGDGTLVTTTIQVTVQGS
jgi:hypothetical protein